MLKMLMASTLSIILPMVVLTATIMLSARSMGDREKLSPFECGFDPNHTARIPFSLRFFLLAIMFIVFDIEIVLLMPLPLILHTATCTQIAGGIIFLLILVIGLLHEWHQGSLNWSY